MNIYVGNLPQGATEEDLRKAFDPFGQVASLNIIKDRYSGAPRGLGFVEMPTQAQAAISSLNGTQLKGQTLTVNEARPRSEGGGGGGGERCPSPASSPHAG